MSGKWAGGVLALSIDLELDRSRPSADRQRDLESLVARLVDLLNRYHAGATWAMADPTVSAATERVLASRTEHEIALLGEPSWVGRSAGRAHFAQQLQQRVGGGHAAGLQIGSLLIRGAELDEHLDLVVKHGLSAVCSLSRCPAPPRSLHYGLWELPATMYLPQRRWLFTRMPVRRARRAIDQAIQSESLCHLVLDGPRLAALGMSGVRRLENVLRHADLRRRQGVLSIATLSAVAAQLTCGQRSQPARSILRPAA